MGITHIMRPGVDSSGPLHIILYEAFGWEPHGLLPPAMVMGKDGQALQAPRLDGGA